MHIDKRPLYNKFQVRRTDGRDAPGEKHDDCTYFVLDLDHDEFAEPAIRAYAEACKETHPQLAKSLRVWLEGNCSCRGESECQHFGRALAYKQARTPLTPAQGGNSHE